MNFKVGDKIRIDISKLNYNDIEIEILLMLKHKDEIGKIISIDHWSDGRIDFNLDFPNNCKFRIKYELLCYYFIKIDSPNNSKISNKKYIQLDQTN